MFFKPKILLTGNYLKNVGFYSIQQKRRKLVSNEQVNGVSAVRSRLALIYTVLKVG